MTTLTSAAPVAALLCVAGFGLIAPPVARGARPAPATWLLTLGAATAAVSGLTVLAMVALPLVGRDDALADYAHLSPRVLAKETPSGIAIAALSLAALLVLLLRATARLARQWQAGAAAARLASRLGPTAGDLVVLPTESVDVYALPGRPGVIVATRGLLRALHGEERRAVLAHERAHLRHHHHGHLRAVALAASLNPLLAKVPAAASYAVERWADEVSALLTSREVTATALSRVAHLSGDDSGARPTSAVAAASVAVQGRIAALRSTPPRLRPLWLALPIVLSATAVLATAVVIDQTSDDFITTIAVRHHPVVRQWETSTPGSLVAGRSNSRASSSIGPHRSSITSRT